MHDFKDVMSEMNRNKKVHTALLKTENQIDKKSHVIISLKLDKKLDKFKKFSQLNFCELCGSEQAVAQVDDSFIDDSENPNLSIRDFATQSFNSLSANLLKVALRGKIKTDLNKNEAMVTKCLSETMTYKSKILLI